MSPRPAAGDAHVSITPDGDPADVERILRSLPEWFGIEAAIRQYVADAADPGFTRWTAVLDGRAVGVALLRQRSPETTELHLLAVEASEHRRGVGRRLVSTAADQLSRSGTLLFSVHTVGPSFTDEHYARTRRFYRAMGFLPLEEHDGIDWDGPTLISVMPLVRHS